MSSERTVAAFDLDGTITDGDSLLPFLASVAGRFGLASGLLWTLPRLAWGWALGGRHRDSAKEALIGRVLGGLDAAEVAGAAESFAAELAGGRVWPGVRERMDWHRSRGHEVVVVSASPELYVAPVGRLLGVDAVLCTSLEMDAGGRLTGRFRGGNCRGPEKATRLRAWLGDGPVSIWAYGDSSGDTELLAMADVAVKVGRRPLHALP